MAAPAALYSGFGGVAPIFLSLEDAVSLIKKAGPSPALLHQLRTDYNLTMQHGVDATSAVVLAGQKAALRPSADLDWTRLKKELTKEGVRQRWASSSPARTTMTLRSRDTKAFARSVLIWTIGQMSVPANYCSEDNRTHTDYMVRKKRHEAMQRQAELALQQRDAAIDSLNAAQAVLRNAQNATAEVQARAQADVDSARAAVLRAEDEQERLRVAGRQAIEDLEEERARVVRLQEQMSDMDRQEIQLQQELRAEQRKTEAITKMKVESDNRLRLTQQHSFNTTHGMMMAAQMHMSTTFQQMQALMAYTNQFAQLDQQNRAREVQAGAGVAIEGMPDAVPAAAPMAMALVPPFGMGMMPPLAPVTNPSPDWVKLEEEEDEDMM